MTTKEYLNQYRIARAKVERCRERLAQIQESLDSKSTSFDAMPRPTGISKPTETNAIRLAETRERLEETMRSTEVVRQQIADEIEQVDGVIYQELLYGRYVQGLEWEDVTRRVSRYRDRPYAEPHVRGYMHAEALRRFEEKILKKD